MATSSGGLSYTATVPADTDIAGAMTAFQNYTSIVYIMETKVEHSNDLVKYADGNVLTIANNFITFERSSEFAYVGTQTLKVTSATKDAGNPPVVSIDVCADNTKMVETTNSGPRNGMQASPPPTHPYPVTYRIHKGADGKWRVNAVTAKATASC